MSINVYLKAPVANVESFTLTELSAEDLTARGVTLRQDETGRYFIGVREPTDVLPMFLLDYVDEITYLEHFTHVPMREFGRYSVGGTATATVMPLVLGGKLRGYEVRVTKATRMEDVSELVQAILAGTIRPEPGKSYAGEQAGLSREELEAEVQALRDHSANILSQLRAFYAEAKAPWKFGFLSVEQPIWQTHRVKCRVHDILYACILFQEKRRPGSPQ